MIIKDVEFSIQEAYNIFKFNFKRDAGSEYKDVEIYVFRSHIVSFSLEKFKHLGINPHNVDDFITARDPKHKFNKEDARMFLLNYLYSKD